VQQKLFDIFRLMQVKRIVQKLLFGIAICVSGNMAIAAYGDLVINELMPDPTPVVGLPDKEYVEIFNTTNSSINLAGWKLSDGTTTVTLSGYTLPSNSYLVLCSNADTALFKSLGPTLGVGTLPSLNNTGDNISLLDNVGILTDFLGYSLSYYQDAAKDDGGFSLERINPFIGCSGLNNWKASNASAGGTPGIQNSIYDNSTVSFIPKLLSVSVAGPSLIIVQYNDAMDPNNISDAYTLTGGTISSVSSNTGRDIDSLSLFAAIDPGTIYTLIISGRKNCADIALPDTSILIALGVEGFFLDVIFTEIMADPTPLVGLPDAEYLEIHNRTSKPINLAGWDLSDGSSSVTLGNLVILPDDYLVFTTTSAATAFDNPKVIGITGFPSLTNSGEQLALYNASDELVHSVLYSDAWHTNSVKKDGGWSLEMVDMNNPCQENGNWVSSNAAIGGTPAAVNSVAGTVPDEVALGLLEVQVTDNTHLVAFFSKKINPESLASAGFSIDNGVGSVSTKVLERPSLTSVLLTLDSPVSAGIIYTLSVTGLYDCGGISIGSLNEAMFALPEEPEAGDLIINEVLFNPRTNGFDFVELYNKSDKAISSKFLAIAEKDVLTGETIEFTSLAATNKLIFPGEYLVLTENPDVVQQQYTTLAPNAFLAVPGMPNWPDDNGIVSLQHFGDMSIIDELNYSNDWHYKLLDDEDGVSLERINPANPTQDKGNWHSAAQSIGFATPGYKNSSYLQPGITDGFTLSPEVFSPDQDGFEDILSIQYAFNKPGNLMNIYIFDTEGRRVSHLVRNQTVGQEGFYTWDGIIDDGTRARVGIYIIVMESTDIQDGKVDRMKGKCVVAAKLN